MITKLQEITDWGDARVANGIYHVNNSNELVGYEGPKTGYKKFKNPMKRFNKARRKFEVIGTYEDPNEVAIADDDPNSWKFEGSKGNTYIVTNDGGHYRCTCPGFKYRGKCKHSDEIIASGPGGQAPAWQ